METVKTNEIEKIRLLQEISTFRVNIILLSSCRSIEFYCDPDYGKITLIPNDTHFINRYIEKIKLTTIEYCKEKIEELENELKNLL